MDFDPFEKFGPKPARYPLLGALNSGSVFFDVVPMEERASWRVIFFAASGGRHKKVAEILIVTDLVAGSYSVQEVPFDTSYRPLVAERYYSRPIALTRGQVPRGFVLLSDGGEEVALMISKSGVARLAIKTPGAVVMHYSTKFEPEQDTALLTGLLRRLVAQVERLEAQLSAK